MKEKKWSVRACRHLLLGELSHVKYMHTRNRQVREKSWVRNISVERDC